jgi:hypothetical protein
VLLQEDSDLARSILKALENTAYFHFTREVLVLFALMLLAMTIAVTRFRRTLD